MTRISHDQFAKLYLAELLAPLGAVEVGREVPGEVQLADVWFIPGEVASAERQILGLLSQMASSPCLLEPFWNSPSRAEVRSCLLSCFCYTMNSGASPAATGHQERQAIL